MAEEAGVRTQTMERLGWQARWLAPFSRVQASGAFIPVIDGLRFYAFMSVIALHWAQEVAVVENTATGQNLPITVFLNGAFGVQLFYVISGFVLGLPYARAWRAGRPRPELRRYYLRRLTRLEPPYLINLVVFLLFYVLILHPGSFRRALPEFLASLTYTHGFIYGGRCVPNAVTWTLEIEVQFYLLAPFLSRVFAPDNSGVRRGILALAMLAIPAVIRAGHWESQTYISLLGSIQYFLAGFLLADIYLTDWREAPNSNVLFDVPALAAGAGLMFHVYWARNGYELALPFLVLVFYIAVFRSVFMRRLTENIWLVTLGGMCYTVYLYHPLAVWFLAPYVMHLRLAGWPAWANIVLQLIVVTPFILAFCAVLFALFERPFMKRDWHKRLFAAKSEVRETV